MRRIFRGLALGLSASLAALTGAELQNMEVGGQIIVLGEYYTVLTKT